MGSGVQKRSTSKLPAPFLATNFGILSSEINYLMFSESNDGFVVVKRVIIFFSRRQSKKAVSFPVPPFFHINALHVCKVVYRLLHHTVFTSYFPLQMIIVSKQSSPHCKQMSYKIRMRYAWSWKRFCLCEYFFCVLIHMFLIGY